MATVSFEMAGMLFEYDDDKNQKNIIKHGIDFRSAARVFFDYDRIECIDEEHSDEELRYNTIGDVSAADSTAVVIGAHIAIDETEVILFVVYTDRTRTMVNGEKRDVTRLISARLATEFERGLYYGKY